MSCIAAACLSNPCVLYLYKKYYKFPPYFKTAWFLYFSPVRICVYVHRELIFKFFFLWVNWDFFPSSATEVEESSTSTLAPLCRAVNLFFTSSGYFFFLNLDDVKNFLSMSAIICRKRGLGLTKGNEVILDNKCTYGDLTCKYFG